MDVYIVIYQFKCTLGDCISEHDPIYDGLRRLIRTNKKYVGKECLYCLIKYVITKKCCINTHTHKHKHTHIYIYILIARKTYRFRETVGMFIIKKYKRPVSSGSYQAVNARKI